MCDLEQPLAGGEDEHREQAEVRAERPDLADDERDQQPADHRCRQRQQVHAREPPAAERGLQKQQDPHERREPERQERQVRGRILRGPADDLGVVALRERDLRELVLHRRLRVRHGSEVHRSGHVDVARESLVLNVERVRADADGGDA